MMYIRKLTCFTQRNSLPAAPIIAAIIGISIGFYLLTIFSLPHRLMTLFALGAACVFVFMLVGNLRKSLLAVIIFDTALQLDINFFNNNEVAALGALGGLNLSMTTISLIVLYVIWFGQILLKAKSVPTNIFKTSAPLIVYFGFACLSIAVANNRLLSLFEIGMLFQMLLLFFYIIGTVRTREDVIFILLMLTLSLAVESLINIGLNFAGRSFEFLAVAARVEGGERIAGTLGDSNVAGGFLGLLLAPVLAITMAAVKKRYKYLAGVTFFCGCVALILTFSRGAWIGSAFSISFLIFFGWRSGWLSRSITITIIIFMIILNLLYFETFLMRLLQDDLGAAYSRIPLMKLAVKIIVDHPIWGVGVNNFAILIDEYARKGFHDAWLYTVHNKYLLVFAETGIGGLIAFLWFLTTTLRRGWIGYRIKDSFLSPVALGLLAAVLGSMIHMTVELFNARPTVQLLWLIAGLITAIYCIFCEEEKTGLSQS